MVHRRPEAVLRLHPDLVLAARFGTQATVAALTALGLRVLHWSFRMPFTARAASILAR